MIVERQVPPSRSKEWGRGRIVSPHTSSFDRETLRDSSRASPPACTPREPVADNPTACLTSKFKFGVMTEAPFPSTQLLQHPWVAQGRTKVGEQHLSHFKQSMTAYNARRKFRATIMTVQLMAKLGKVVGGPEENDNEGGTASARQELAPTRSRGSRSCCDCCFDVFRFRTVI